VLRQVVPLQQVVEARVQLTAAGSWAVEVAAYDKPLLGRHELVEQICELPAEWLRDGAGRSVEAGDCDKLYSL